MDPQPERAATSISLSAYVRLVRHNRNFRCLWLAQIVSEIGDWFYTLAIYSLLRQLTGRASSVALALWCRCFADSHRSRRRCHLTIALRRKR